MIKSDIPKKIPDEPGVYIFKKRGEKTPLYIGKATSLRSRVRSYFSSDLGKTRGANIVSMVELANKIEIKRTDSVLEALILEAKLIKELQPKFNVLQRDDKSFNYVVITKEDYPEVRLMRGKELSNTDANQYKKIFGPFPHGGELRIALKIIRKLFPWRDKKCLPSRQAGTPGSANPCFNRQIGLCPGVCTSEISRRNYNFIIRNLTLFFEGRKKQVVKNLEKEMKICAKRHEFEEAAKIRNKIFALGHIEDVALLKKDTQTFRKTRIEAYDIAHISGLWVVGVMVVLTGNKVDKNEYRKFRIRSNKGVDDTGNLSEILNRRLGHDEWPMPDLIIVDGGKAQYNAAKKVLENNNLNIPVIGATKGSTHKVEKLIGDESILKGIPKEDIILANAEAHRFAINYHRGMRRKSLSSNSK